MYIAGQSAAVADDIALSLCTSSHPGLCCTIHYMHAALPAQNQNTTTYDLLQSLVLQCLHSTHG